jgi:hypothetical protein
MGARYIYIYLEARDMSRVSCLIYKAAMGEGIPL